MEKGLTMRIGTLLKAAIPVIIGVIAAGVLMNALRDNEYVKKAINGFDS